ncbi:TPA: NYN domain-containing protein, partial [Streptococcus agalactiae]
AAAELNQSVLNLVSVATSDLNEQWTIFSQGALRVSARELEQRVATVKSDLDKMSSQIDLSTPKLRPWNDEQLGKLKDFLDGM